MTNNKW